MAKGKSDALFTACGFLVAVISGLLTADLAAQTAAPPWHLGSEASWHAGQAEPTQDRVTPTPQPSAERKQNEWKKFFRNVTADQKTIWTSPFHLKREEAKWWIVFGGATAAFIATDEWTAKQLPNTRDQVAVSRWVARLGASYTILPITATFWIVGKTTDNQRARETGRIGVEALADAFLVTSVIKLATMRERPLEGDGNGSFWHGQARFRNAGSSLPSGHATYSWTLASVMAHQYPQPRIIPVAAYALASVVSASRFTVRRHFASDIVLGGAIGWFMGHYVHGKRHESSMAGSKPGVRSWLACHVHLGVPPQGFMLR